MHAAHILLVEPQGLPAAGADDDVAGAVGRQRGDELVALLQPNGLQAGGADVGKLLDRRFLDGALPGHHEEVLPGARQALGERNDGIDRFAGFQLQEVHHGGAAGLPAGLGNLVALQFVHPAPVRKEQQPVMGRGHEDLVHDVLFPRRKARYAHAAAPLGLVGVGGQTLDVAHRGERDDHFLLLNQVLVLNLGGVRGDLGAAVVAKAVGDLLHLLANHLHQQPFVIENRGELGNQPHQALVLLNKALALHAGEPLQAHIEDGLGLRLGKAEAGDALGQQTRQQARVGGGKPLLHEESLGLGGVGGPADQRDDLVEHVHRQHQAFEDVGPGTGALQVEPGTAGHDVLLVVDVVAQHGLQRHYARVAVHQRQHVHAEGLLQLGVLVEEVEHNASVDVALQLDHNPHAGAVGLVADVGDALELLLLHELGNLLDQPRLVDLIGDFLHDDAGAVGTHVLHLAQRPHDDPALPGAVGPGDAVAAHHLRAGREVRPGDVVHQLLGRNLGVVDHRDRAGDHLPQIMRRDVCGHADGDATGTVHQEVREPAGQHARLGRRLVEVGHEVDGLLFDVPQHLHRDLRQPGLGVPHRGGAVAIHRAKVAVALHQHRAGGEVLRQAHHRVVDRGIAVGVVFTEHVADDTHRFAEGLVRRNAQLVHRVEDAPVHRLQAVAHVGQRPVDNRRHGVGDEALLHLLFQVDRYDLAVFQVEVHGCSCSVVQSGCAAASRAGSRNKMARSTWLISSATSSLRNRNTVSRLPSNSCVRIESYSRCLSVSWTSPSISITKRSSAQQKSAM